MKINWHKQQRGTTLVECLVGIVLIGIVSASLYTIFDYGAQSWRISQESSEDQQTARMVLHRISNAVRMSSIENISLFNNRSIFIEGKMFRLIGTDLRNEHHNPIASGINNLDFTKIQCESGIRYEVANNSTQWDLLRITIETGEMNDEIVTYIKPRN